MKKYISLLLFALVSFAPASVIPAAEHAISYDIVVIGKYYKDDSGGGHLIYDIIKGSVDEKLFSTIRKTSNLGQRKDGSSTLFLFTQKPRLKVEIHMINKNDVVWFGIEGVTPSCSIQDIRAALPDS